MVHVEFGDRNQRYEVAERLIYFKKWFLVLVDARYVRIFINKKASFGAKSATEVIYNEKNVLG